MPASTTLTTPEKIQKLKLFNSKVDTCRRGRFVQQTFGPGKQLGFTLNFQEQSPCKITKRGPDEEAVLALVTSLRFFIQRRDGIHFDQIAEIYASLPIGNAEKESARRAVDTLNRYLDSPIAFVFHRMTISHRQLFDTILYGGLAHANDNKRPQYEQWMEGSFAPFSQLLFEEIAATLLSPGFWFYPMNEKTMLLLRDGSQH